EHAPDPIYFKDLEGRFLRVNQAYADLLGVASSGMLVGRTEFDFVDPAEARSLAEEDRKVRDAGAPVVGHEEMRHRPDGEELWLSITRVPLNSADDQVVGSFGIARDITSIRRNAARLRELSQAVEQSPSVVMITNVQGDITYVNPKFTALTGYLPEEVLGKNPRILKAEGMADGLYRNLWETISGGRAWTGEILNRKKNGEQFWGLASISPIRDEQGKVTDYIEVMEDISHRKRVEEALQHRLEFQRFLMDAIPVPVFHKNRAGIFQDCNRAFEEFIGRSRERILGHTVFDISPHALADVYHRKDEALFHDGTSQTYESSVLHGDGTYHEVLFNKAVLLDASGVASGLVGTIVDLTELKQARQELRVQHERLEELEAIIGKSPAIVFLWKAAPGWPVDYVSDSIVQLGYSPDDFLKDGLPFSKIVHPDDLPWISAEVERYSRTGVNEFHQEYRLFSRRGDVRWVDDRTWVRRNTAGSITHYQGIIMDITEQKQARERAAAMLQGLRVILTLADRLLACATTQALYKTAVGLARDELKLERTAILIRDGDRIRGTYGTNLKGQTTDETDHVIPFDERWAERLRVNSESGKPWQVEEEAYFEWDGQDMVGLGQGWVAITPITSHEHGAIGAFCNDAAISGAPVDDVQQELLAVFCAILGNIIARKRAEEERAEAQVRQREILERTDRLSSLGMLAAGMAHEINNPLQGMLSHLHSVQQSLPETFPERSSLDMVERGIETIDNLVRKLLILGKPEDLAEEAVDLREALGFVIQLLSRQFRKSRVTIETHLPAEALTLAMPRRYLIQILMNLLINAHDALPKGGTVRVRAARDGDAVDLLIEDNGVGMTGEQAANVFKAFFTTKGTKGTGLGLSVADSLVRSCHGTISVDSQPGKGTTFKIHMPMAKEQSQP
ncbi:MAG: PAS domain S-box protein, partial [Kiritimatiellae bacterium]|nr:PAS domain S-box protein [Kiritimatiellia bacterium]